MAIRLNCGTQVGYWQIERVDVYGSSHLFNLDTVWSPTAGQEYDLEVNWDLVTGSHRVFIDGVTSASGSVTGTVSGTVCPF